MLPQLCSREEVSDYVVMAWGCLSQHCSQPDAATEQYRSRKQPYRNPSLNSGTFIGSAYIPEARSAWG